MRDNPSRDPEGALRLGPPNGWRASLRADGVASARALAGAARIGGVLSGLLILLLGAPASARDWTTYHAGPSRTSTTGEKVPLPFDSADPSGNWVFTVAGNLPIGSSATVVANRVYFGSRNGNVYCLRARTDAGGPGGSLVWSFATGGTAESSPTYFKGRLFFGSGDGYLYCIRASDGEMVWRTFHGGTQLSSPAVDDNVCVFAVGDPSNEVRGYDSNLGCFLWAYNTGQIAYSSPVLPPGLSRAFSASDNGNHFGLDPLTGPDSGGNPHWTVSSNGGVFTSTPAYDVTSNSLYFLAGDHDRNLYRVSAGDDPTTGGVETEGTIRFKNAPYHRATTSTTLLLGAVTIAVDSVDGFIDPAQQGGAPQWAKIVDGASSEDIWYSALDTATNTLSGIMQDTGGVLGVPGAPGAAGTAFAHVAVGKVVHNFADYTNTVVSKSGSGSEPPAGSSGKPIVPGASAAPAADSNGTTPTSVEPYVVRTPVPAGVWDELQKYPPGMWGEVINGWEQGCGQDLNWLREAVLPLAEGTSADGNLQKVGGFASGDSVTFNIVKTSSPAIANGRVYFVHRETGTTEEYQLHVMDAVTGVRIWSYAQNASTRIELESSAPTPAVTPLDGASGPMVYAAWGNNLLCFDESLAVTSRRAYPGTFYKTGTATVSSMTTTLTAAALAGAATLTVASTTGFPTPGTGTTEGDFFGYTGKTATTLTGVSGIDAGHGSGVAVTIDSVPVTGAGTSWFSLPNPATTPLWLVAADGRFYRIASVISATSLTLTTTNTVAASGSYVITSAQPLDGNVHASTTIADGQVYVPTFNGSLYAFQSANHAPSAPTAFTNSAMSNPPQISWSGESDADAGDGSSLVTEVQVAYAPIDVPTPAAIDLLGEFERFVVTGASSQSGTTISGASSFTLPNIVPTNTHVFYRVRTRDPRGAQSAWSDLQEFWVGQDTSAPLPPASVTAIPGDATAQLFWTASPSAGVIGYNVYGREMPAGAFSGPASFGLVYDAAFTSLPDGTPLANGTMYEFSVRAVSQGEVESADALVNVTPATAVAIGGTGYLTVAAAADGAVSGDTITLGVGTFSVGAGLILPAGVSLRGYGPGFTILDGMGTAPYVISVGGTTADPKVTISMLTVRRGAVGIAANTANVRIQNVVACRNFGSDDSDGAITADNGGELELINVTVAHNNSHGVLSAATQTSARNTEVCWNNRNGIKINGGSATVRYGDAYGNVLAAYSGVNPTSGDGNIASMPRYLDKLHDDYRVEADNWDVDSPTVDAGQPTSDTTGPDALAYGDYSLETAPNGGRVNQGAFGNTEWAALSIGPPTPGTVFDGSMAGIDADTQTAATTIAGNWSGFGAGQGIDESIYPLTFEWAIGTSAGGEQIQAYVGVGSATSANASDLSLLMNVSYFVSVRATNVAGLSSVVSSDGTMIPPPSGGGITGGVNASGATLTVPAAEAAIGGSSITVPAGTTFTTSGGPTTSSETLTITNATTSIYASLTPVGSPVSFEPLSLVFSQTVSLTVPYVAASIPTGRTSIDVFVLRRNVDGTVIDMLPATSVDTTNGTVTVSAIEFGTFQSFVEPVYDENGDGVTDPIVAGEVDAGGGTVTAPSSDPWIGDAECVVPAGTTYSDPADPTATTGTLIIIRQGTTIVTSAIPVGFPVRFGPDGMTFSQAVTVTIAYDPVLIPAGRSWSEIRILKRNDTTSEVTSLIPTSIDTTAGTASVPVTSFSTFQPFIGAVTTGGSSGGSSSGSSGSGGSSSSSGGSVTSGSGSGSTAGGGSGGGSSGGGGCFIDVLRGRRR